LEGVFLQAPEEQVNSITFNFPTLAAEAAVTFNLRVILKLPASRYLRQA